jgi:hypothetical protein
VKKIKWLFAQWCYFARGYVNNQVVMAFWFDFGFPKFQMPPEMNFKATKMPILPPFMSNTVQTTIIKIPLTSCHNHKSFRYFGDSVSRRLEMLFCPMALPAYFKSALRNKK